MPSKFKTDNLQLNKWIETDRPTRDDFVSDNSIIDKVLGEHINSGIEHLTSDEKLRVQQPYVLKLYQGTGDESRKFTFDFEPAAVLMFAFDTTPVEIENGKLVVNCCAAVKSYGSTKNCSLISKNFMVSQKTEESTVYNFNNREYLYIILAFR